MKLSASFDNIFNDFNKYPWNNIPEKKISFDYDGVFGSLTQSHIVEKDNTILISLCMPGIDKTKIKVKYTNSLLSVTYDNKDADTFWKKKNYSYTKQFENVSDITAEYVDGILYIYMKKKKENSKEIEVK